ncbi:MAG: flagellar biosynthesis protein FlgA [Negativicutes bacterium]|nr:flagellar biosynthesis protein FlgA [Negativicutes bacterium]
MIYETLYKHAKKKSILAGIIGSGHYGTAVITQAAYNDYLKIPVIADQDVKKARLAYERAGLTADQIVVCDSAPAAKKVIESGKYAIVQDPMLLMDLPLDVIVESTGIAEVGARHGRAAIESGKHIVMINKETDATVGPILQHMAQKKGLVYTQVDGDQHGLLIGLVSWARTLGLEIVSGGKARDSEFVLNRRTGIATSEANGVNVFETQTLQLSPEQIALFDDLPYGKAAEYVQKREALFTGFPTASGFDLCEMVVAMNATGLKPDIPGSHHPIARTSQIPHILCPQDEGGILTQSGILDMVTCFRDDFEAGLGGGVFIVVSCENDYSRMILTTKGLISNKSGKSALIFRPHHLCGVETPTSIVCAGLLGVTTGSDVYRPDYDIVQTAKYDLKAGYVFHDDHDPGLRTTVLPSSPMAPGNPVPAHLLQFYPLLRDVSAGTMITYDMVAKPVGAALWELREQQDKLFLAGK